MKYQLENNHRLIKVDKGQLKEIMNLLGQSGYQVEEVAAADEVIRTSIKEYFDDEQSFLSKIFKDFGKKGEPFEDFYERLIAETVEVALTGEFTFPSHDDVSGFIELALLYLDEA